MELIPYAIMVGLIPAVIAHNKGRSFLLWWIYGALISIVAIPHALLIKKTLTLQEEELLSQGSKRCPYCAEIIRPEAVVCRYCGRDIVGAEPPTVAVSVDSLPDKKTEPLSQNLEVRKSNPKIALLIALVAALAVGSFFYLGIADSMRKERQAAVEITKIEEAIKNGEGVYAKVLYSALVNPENPLAKTRPVLEAAYLVEEIEEAIRKENGSEGENALF